MNNGQKSLSINETFIIESENDGTMSACTGFFTNALVSCTGNTQILLGNNLIETNSAFSATTFYGDGSNLTGISTQDTFVTGGTYNQNSGVATFINNTGGTFNVTGFYTGATDVYVTAVTFTNNLLTLYRNDGATFGATINDFTSLNVNGPVSATTFYGDGSNLSGISTQDTFVTGGTYFDGVTTFTNNTGGTFTIDGPSNYNSGIIIGGENWVDNGNGSINLPEIKVALFDNPDYIEPLKIYTIASGTTGVGGIPPLADNDTNYIIVEYNNGLPRYNVLDNDGTVDNSDIVLYMIVYRANNFVHTLEFGNMGAGLPNKLTTRLIATDRFARESGCALGLSGSTGIVTLSSGAVWNGPNRQIVSAVNSQDDVFFKSFHSGGTWVYTTTGNTINNIFYDDGTNLISATAGKYLVNWYFRGQEVNDHLYELISFGEYDTVQLAEASPEPNLPELITSHAFLVGRVIIEVSATTGITQSAFTTVFQPSGAPVLHNDLAGIQGGIAGEYYHLDSNKYNNLALTNTNNNFSVGQSFSSGLTANTISATTYQNLPISIVSSNNLISTGLNGSGSGISGSISDSIILGQFAGSGVTNAFQSNFFGSSTGFAASNANNSNFLGFQAGYNATNAQNSNFLGSSAGFNGTNAEYSNFLGANAGDGATNASGSNFFGPFAGQNAESASYSNLFGFGAGFQATNASLSNFFGSFAGNEATNASSSNFLGSNAGNSATNASNSNFFGDSAGRNASGASYSNLFGFNTGYASSPSNSIGSNNIIIGTNITLSAGTTNSLNLGGVLFGTGTYSATTGNPSITGQTNGRIGIGVVTPQETLHVVGNTRVNGGLTATTISATTYQNLPPSGSILTSGTTLYSTNPSTSNFNTSNSIFLGSNAGFNATSASGSNFLGQNAGSGATNANDSNFFGFTAGNSATNASYSNFLGWQAGLNATNASLSNFLGINAGFNATGASRSNFFGSGAGQDSRGATSSNFLGFWAGRSATNANNSNFLGSGTGFAASNANNSNFFGVTAGEYATNAADSNFFGQYAGNRATNANNSNFFGQYAGQNAQSASYSNLFGFNVGRASFGPNSIGSNNIIIGTNITLPVSGTNRINLGNVLYGTNTYSDTISNPSFTPQVNGRIGIGVVNPTETLHVVGNTRIQGGLTATTISATTYQNLPLGSIATSGTTLYSTNPSTSNFNSSNSIFLGNGAGSGATVAQFSNFLGEQAGRSATNAFYSNFLGSFAGNGAAGASNSNFFGNNAGQSATAAANSNFIGQNAGQSATNAGGSNFFGVDAGQSATGASQSNFLGVSAGQNATAANNSNFLGSVAGFQATNARNSNFLGLNTGRDATNASSSNFLGTSAGQNATAANNSNFLGPSAGFGATNAFRSNFLGVSAGQNATGASQSNLFGWRAGFANSTSNSIGSNNIIIGNNITLQSGTTNSINLGGVLFGTGSYSVTAGTPSLSAQTTGRIGIGVVIPQETLHVSGNTRVDGGLSATTISATTYLGISTQDTFVTGGTYSNGTAVFTNNTGGTFNVTGLTTPFTGGTVNGVTNFTGGLGVGVAVPTTRLHISGATAGDSGLRLETLTSVTPVSLGQAIGVDGNGNIVTINNVSGSTGPRPITTVITDTTLTDLDQVVIVDSTTPITITLPQITISGRLITIKNINTGVETILPYSGQLIDGDTSIVVARKNVSLDFQSYNNNWYLI
jgi:hypothetical protein